MGSIIDAMASDHGYQPAPYRRDPEETVQCPNCDRYDDPDAKYCDQCGHPLKNSAPYSKDSDDNVQCPECKKYNASDAEFCDQCGIKLEGRNDVSVDNSKSIGDRVKVPMLLDTLATKDLGDGAVECTVTTPSVDRMSEVITTDGIDTGPYLKNPVVLFSHEYGALPIGKSIRLVQQKKSIKSTTQFAVDEYEFAATVYKLVKGGYMNDVSIGVIVKQWSPDYKTIEQSEMLEYSHVPVGANVDAKVTARSFERIGKSMDEVREEYVDFVQRTMAHKIQKMPYDSVTQSIRVLRNLVDTLEASASPDHSSGQEPIARIRRVTLHDSAKAVATQSQRVIRTIKLKG